MFHIIYKTIHPSGKYYIGRHTTNDLDDGYMGSGRWVTSIEDKSILTREVLFYYDTEEELIENETRIIREHFDDPLNMNWNDSGVGWSSSTNPAKSPEWKKRFSGDGNPARNPEVKERIRRTVQEQYMNGRVGSFTGRRHTQETKDKQSSKMKGRDSWNKGVTGYNTKPQTENQKQKAREANQKEWFIWFPDGTYEIITNLRQWAKDNNADQGNLVKVAHGKAKQHKGFIVWQL